MNVVELVLIIHHSPKYIPAVHLQLPYASILPKILIGRYPTRMCMMQNIKDRRNWAYGFHSAELLHVGTSGTENPAFTRPFRHYDSLGLAPSPLSPNGSSPIGSG
ncbi:MAG: hypothetical protein C7B44_08855 [Sulfobacillus thermosulfidooxidans]|uniref:hypothetical protein n=1 Tax=Sulfobacillus sp. hq2 TaxID=2039167 RepID=UPI000CD30F7F|nr:hypothetical protein [Sulfobacillus sp. hq2]POB11087.1 hypothetical protein CO251_05950 [Sulfobacillus sp. hq2]PSR36480.1 MAG: hypothetical protein C7B44_08855 [Sulfobacillus thermosulfidooxidans]